MRNFLSNILKLKHLLDKQADKEKSEITVQSKQNAIMQPTIKRLLCVGFKRQSVGIEAEALPIVSRSWEPWSESFMSIAVVKGISVTHFSFVNGRVRAVNN